MRKKKDNQKAREYLEESYQLFQELSREDIEAISGAELGYLLCLAGQKERGMEILERSILYLERLGLVDEVSKVREIINHFQ